MRTLSRLRTLGASLTMMILATALVVIPADPAAAANPGDPLIVCGNTSNWGAITGGNTDDLRDKLGDLTAFGPGGTYSTSTFTTIGITTGAPTLAQLNANNCDIWFSGYDPGADYTALATWQAAGGFVIAGCDNSNWDAACAPLGYPVTNYSNIPGEIIYDASYVNPLTCGGDALSLTTAGGASAYFTNGIPLAAYSDANAFPLVITDDLANPGMLLTADIDMFTDFNPNITSGPGIVTDQDQFVYNVFAYAAAAVTGQIAGYGGPGCPAEVNLIVEKETTVPVGSPTNPVETFFFDIACDDGWTETISVITDQNVTATSAQGLNQSTHAFSPGVTCTVTEQDPPDPWIVTSTNPQTITMTDVDGVLTFTNEPSAGEVVLEKVIVGGPAGVDYDSIVFTVDIVCTGFTLSDQPVSVATSPVTVGGIPDPASCVVTEDPTVGFTPTYSSAVDKSGNRTVTITNSTGELIIAKQTVAPDGIDPTATFTYDVVCDNGFTDTVSVTASTLNASGAVGQLGYDDLPLIGAGTTCEITEQATPGWTADTNPVTVTVTTNHSGSTAVFTNTRDLDSLTITKTIGGDVTGLDDMTFTIDVSCTGGFSPDPFTLADQTFSANTPLVIPDLPTGAVCTAVEDEDLAMFATTQPDPITIGAAPSSTVNVLNEFSTFEVEKVVSAPPTQSISSTGTFTFAVTCTTGYTGTHTITLSTDDVASTALVPPAPLVPPGTSCTIEETGVPAGWTAAAPTSVTGQTQATSTPTVSFGNTRDVADLIVRKQIDGPAGIDLSSETFDVAVTCTGDLDPSPSVFNVIISEASPGTIPDLPVGAVCTFVEDPGPWYTPFYPAPSVTLESDPTTYTVQNRTGTFGVSKTLVAPDGVLASGTFTFEISCTNGYTSTFSITASTTTAGVYGYPDVPLLPSGAQCTVTEQAPPSGWAIVGSASQTVTVTHTSSPVIGFTNERASTSLTIGKVILGVPAGADFDDRTFDVTVTCTGDFPGGSYTVPSPTVISVNTPLVIDDLPTGATCSVVETPDAEFDTSYSPASGAMTLVDGTNAMTVTNTTGSIIVEKTSIVDDTNGASPVGTFSFQITCSNGYSQLHTLTTTLVDSSTAMGAISYDDLPLMPAGTTCTVTETPAAGWTLTSANDVTVTVTPDFEDTASFTNERDLGEVSITKSIVGLPDGADLSTESFTVQVTCIGDFVASPLVIAGLTLSESAPITIDALPIGTECETTETTDIRFTATFEPASTVVGANGTAPPLTVINTTDSFEIVKTVSVPATHSPDASAVFTFEVTCTNGASTTVTTTAGNLSAGTIAHPDLPLVPVGTDCTIAETAVPAGYTPTGAAPAVVVVDGSTPTVTIDNTRDTTALTVLKDVVTIDGLDLSAELFDVTVTCTGDFATSPHVISGVQVSVDAPLVVPDLPTGSICSVAETADDRFTTLYSPESASVTVTDGATIEITNSSGTISITKTISAPAGIEDGDDFVFDVTCTNGYTGTFTITGTTAGSETITHPDLPLVGKGESCTVTERAPPAGWAVLSDNPQTVAIVTADTVDVEFVNGRATAGLTVMKSLEGIAVPGAEDGTPFLVTVTCTGDFPGGSATFADRPVSVDTPLIIPDLPTNAVCVVVEDDTLPYLELTTPPDGTATIDADGETVIVRNLAGTFEIMKSVTAPAGVTADDTFTFDVDCDSGYSGSFTVLAGTGADGTISTVPLIESGARCTVTEVSIPAGWTSTGPNPQTISIRPDQTPTLTFTNERDTSALTVTKTLAQIPSGDDLDDEPFPVTVICSGDFPGNSVTFTDLTVTANTPLVVPALPSGAICTVTETPDDRFTTSYVPLSGATTIDADGELVEITNTTGTFTIAKTVSHPDTHPIDTSATFTFDVSCSNGYEGTVTIDASTSAAGTIGRPDLPLVAPGSTCTITEVAVPAGWTGAVTDPVDVTIPADGTIPQAVFDNTRDTTTITINKILDGIPAGEDFDDVAFTVTVVCTGDFVGGTHTVPGPLTISANTPLTIPDIPVGSTCTFTETADPRFAVELDPATGEFAVPADGSTVVAYNRTGELSIVKFTEVADPTISDAVATFEFRVTCSNGYDETHAITTTDPTATGATGSIGYDTLPLFPDGTECTVTELAPPLGWSVLAPNPVTVTISPDSVAEAPITNTRDAASLTVTKSLNGVPDGTDLDDEPFIVDISCDGSFDPNPYVLTDQILTRNTPIVVPNLPTGAVCTVIEDADDRFSTSYALSGIDPDTGVATIDEDGASVVVINSTGTIAITKSLVAPPGVEDGATFTFDITCTNGYVDTVNVAATTSTVGSIGYPQLPLLAEGTTCEVSEQTPPTGWSLGSPNPVSVTVAPRGVATAAFTNVRDSAGLTITKTLAGVPAGDDLSSEPFTVDVTCTGDFPGGTTSFLGLVVTPTAPLIVEDLPSGAVCTVVEESDDRFTTTYAPANGQVTIDTDGETVAIANSTGTFEIIKSLTAPTFVEDEDTFTFDISCTNGFTDSLTVSASTAASGTIGHPPLPLIAAGSTCSIDETSIPEQWSLTSPSPVSITIPGDGSTPTAAFSNERDTSTLIITKTLDGVPGGESLDSVDFAVDVSCTGDFIGGSYTVPGPLSVSVDTPLSITDLPRDAVCVVTETPDPRFATGYDPFGGQVTLTLDSHTVDVENRTGQLAITKSTDVPDNSIQDAVDTFTFDIVCSNGFSETVTLETTTATTSGATGTIGFDTLPLLPAGTTCSVTEVDVPTGWSVLAPNPVSVTISPDSIAEADFVNTRDSASLTITKALVGVPVGENLDDEPFVVDISCTGSFDPDPYVVTAQTVTANTPLIIPNLPTGAVCTVVEAADDRFATTYTPPHPDLAAGMATIDHDGETIEITNTTGAIAVAKTIAAPDGVEDGDTFTFDISCTNGYADTVTVPATTSAAGTLGRPDLPLLASGATCTVTEQTNPAGWTLATANPVVITVSPDAVATAAFTNTRVSSALTITKTLVGVPPGEDLSSEPFTVDVTCTGDFPGGSATFADQVVSAATPLVIDDLPSGAVCEVTEDPDDRFATTYSPADARVTIDADGETLGITNTTGVFAITKTLTAPDQVADSDLFTFDISCTNGYSDTVVVLATTSVAGTIARPTLPLIAAGSTCTVTEQTPPAGWTIDSPNPVTVTVTGDGSVPTAAFVNDRDVATLTIRKSLDGIPVGENFDATEFDVSVSCTGDFPGGVLTVPGPRTISVNTPLTLTDLPTGAVCTITETPDDRFATSYSSIGGEIELTMDANDITVFNETGELRIVKYTDVADPQTQNPIESFSFRVECSNGYDEVHTIAASTLTASGAMGSLGYNTLPLMPSGTECTITEQPAPAGWTLTTPNPVVVTVGPDAIAEAEFTNIRDTANLTITKTLVGVPADENLSNEPFIVDVSCDGPFSPNPYVLDDLTVTANAPLVIADLPTGSVCTVVEEPDDRFSATYSPTDGSATIDSAGSSIGITNTTGLLEISKSATAPAGVEDGATFTFDVECTNGYADTLTAAASTGSDALIARPTIPLIAAGSDCTVTEQAPPAGWVIGSANPVAVTITAAAAATAAFTNVRETVALTVTKTLVGVPAGLDLDDEPFTVDVTCTGDFAGGSTVFVDRIVTANSDLVIPDLPSGSVCSVVEDDDLRFTTTYAPGDASTTLSATAPEANTIAITNATGAAIIRKTLLAPTTHPISASGVFTFEIACTNGYGGTHTVAASIAGAGEIGYPDLPLLAAGESCTVAETDIPSGWSLSSASPVTVVIPSDGSAPIAEFSNTRDTAGITIGKVLSGVPDTIDLGDETFTLDLTCIGDFTRSPHLIRGVTVSANSPVTVPDLPTGSVCTVVERPDIRFTPVYSPSDELVVNPGSNGIEISNATNAVTIAKMAEVDPTHQISPVATFEFDFDCDNGHSGTHRVTTNELVTGGATGVLDDDAALLFPTGTTCTVTEIADPFWEILGESTITVTIDGAVELDFLNRRRTADLIVTKSLVGVPSSMNIDTERFPVTVTCATGFVESAYDVPGPLLVSAAEPLVVTGLPTGAACSVVEDPDDRFLVSYEPAQSVGIGNDGALVDVVNTTGSYRIVKTTEAPPTDLPLLLDDTFSYEILCVSADDVVVHSRTLSLTTSGNAGAIAAPTAPLLAPGTSCQISELDAYGWDLVSAVAADGEQIDENTLEVTIPIGEVETRWINERQLADFEVHKTLVGVPEGALFEGRPFAERRFTIDVSCTGDFTPSPFVLTAQTMTADEPFVVRGLPVGTTCSPVEAPEDEFIASYLPLDWPPIVEENGGWAEVTNATGTFILMKNTTYDSPHPIDPRGTFSFHVVCSDGYDEILRVPVNQVTVSGGTGAIGYDQVPLFKPGTTCTVSEVDVPPGWTLVSENEQTVTITSDDQPTLRFINERDTAALDITKQIEGLPDGLDLSDDRFDITVTCTGGYLDEPYRVPGDLQISENEGLTVEKLPTLTDCSVDEAPDPRFGTVYSPAATVTISPSGSVVTVINQTSTFELTKVARADSELPVDLDEPWVFDATCIAPSGDVIYTDTIVIETVGGRVTDGPTVSELMPPNTDCTVRERPNERWLTEASLDGVGINHDPARFRTVVGSRDLEFRNTRVMGQIIVTKEIAALRGWPDDVEFELAVRCTGGLQTVAHVLDPAPRIKPGERLVLDRLPEGATCEISEPNPTWQDLTFVPSYVDTDLSSADTSDIGETDALVRVRAIDPHEVEITNTFAVDLAYSGAGRAGPLTRAALALVALGILLLAIAQPLRRLRLVPAGTATP